MLLRVFTRINFFYYPEMSGLPLCAFILVFERLRISWVMLWPTWDSCQSPMASPWRKKEEWVRHDEQLFTPLKQLCIPESKAAPMCSQGLITEVNSQVTLQLARCLLNTEKCNRIYRSGGCAAACCFLKPATKRQTEGTGESARPDLNNIWLAGHAWLMKQFVWPARWSGDTMMFGSLGAWERFSCLPPACQLVQAWRSPSQHMCTSQLRSCQNKWAVTVNGEAEEREGRWEDKEDGRPEAVIEAVLVRYDERCSLNLLSLPTYLLQWGVLGQNPIVWGTQGWVTKFIPLLFHASHHVMPDKVWFV